MSLELAFRLLVVQILDRQVDQVHRQKLSTENLAGRADLAFELGLITLPECQRYHRLANHESQI